MSDDRFQAEEFAEAARTAESDEGQARWNERLKKIAKQKASTPRMHQHGL